jgi:hypothetical protein
MRTEAEAHDDETGMTPSELSLLRTYADGPLIWDAASLMHDVLSLADQGLIEPVPDPERPGVYQLTDAGRQVLNEQENPLVYEEETRHPDAYEYGEPWGPGNPAPGSAWDTRQKPEIRTALAMWEAAVVNAHGGSARKTLLLTAAQLIEAGDALAAILKNMDQEK